MTREQVELICGRVTSYWSSESWDIALSEDFSSQDQDAITMAAEELGIDYDVCVAGIRDVYAELHALAQTYHQMDNA